MRTIVEMYTSMLSSFTIVFGVMRFPSDMFNLSRLRLLKNLLRPKRPCLSFSVVVLQVWQRGCPSFLSVTMLHEQIMSVMARLPVLQRRDQDPLPDS
jgi:hypothetical protein